MWVAREVGESFMEAKRIISVIAPKYLNAAGKWSEAAAQQTVMAIAKGADGLVNVGSELSAFAAKRAKELGMKAKIFQRLSSKRWLPSEGTSASIGAKTKSSTFSKMTLSTN